MRDRAGEEAEIRSINAVIASQYDTVLYDPEPDCYDLPWYDFRPAARLFGLDDKVRDVLEIGCGCGSLLEYLSRDAGGRLVGIDISTRNCKRARARFASLKRDVSILCADVLDLAPEDLGQFDLVVCVGSLFVVPELVREKMLQLAGACVRPGGLALISHYGGLAGYVPAEIRRIIGDSIDPELTGDQAFEAATTVLNEIHRRATRLGAPDYLIQRLNHYGSMSPGNFYHEMLSPEFTGLRVSDFNRALSGYGVGLVGELPAAEDMLLQGGKNRAVAMDIRNLALPRYTVTLHAKWRDEPSEADFDDAALGWTTLLRREAAGSGRFVLPGQAMTVGTHDTFTAAFLDALAGGPITWRAAVEAAQALAGIDFDNEGVRRSVLQLWQAGAIQATLLEVPAIATEP